MNNKGQTLIIFVILIPIIILMMAIVVDVGILQNEVTKATGVVDMAIHEAFLKGDEGVVETLLVENDIPVENLNVSFEEDEIEVSLTYSVEALFGRIVGLETYDVNVHRVGKLSNDEVIIEKKE